MVHLVSEASTLGTLIVDTRGVVGVVVGTADGEIRASVGSVRDGDAIVAATVTGELNKIGALLGLGELGVASLKAATASRVFAQQSGAVVVIEVDPRRPIAELETKLLTLAWAPEDESFGPPASRMATVPDPPHEASLPPPPADAPSLPVPSFPAPLPMRSSPATGFAAPLRPPPPQPPPPPGAVGFVAPSGGSGPVFTGDLEEFSLPDLLEFLRNSHRTGLLMCTTDIGVGTVQLSRGMIVSADSPNALDLREHLLQRPDLLPEQRHELAALPIECFSETLIVDELGSRDLVPRDELEQARKARIYSAFREMMGWNSGRFAFDPGVPVAANPALALSAQSILMHIYQEQDEQDHEQDR